MNLEIYLNRFFRLIIDYSYQFRFLLLFLVSCLILLPFVYAFFFVHPFADDMAFASMIQEKGSYGFVSDFFQNWSGRYTSLTLLSIPAANPEEGLFLYKILPFLFLSFLAFSIYSLSRELISDSLKRIQLMIISMVIIALHVSYMPEVFSGLYWNCSSYYLLVLSFYLLFLKLIIRYYSQETSRPLLIGILLMVFFISGLHEVLIIYNVILFGFILLYRKFFSSVKKWDFMAISIVLLSILILFMVMKFSGNETRMEVSKEKPKLIFVMVRAFYELILLNFYKVFSSPMGVILLLSSFLFTRSSLISHPRLQMILNLNPLLFILVGSFMIYISHLLTLYAAAYTLPGRVLNMNILLLYFLLFLFFSQIFYKWKIVLETDHLRILIFSLLIFVSFSFLSKNLVTTVSEVRYLLPTLDKELCKRYDAIKEAKLNGASKIMVEPVTVNPRLFTLGEYRKDLNFYNSDKCLFQTSMYFGIKVKLNRKPDLYDFH